MSFNELENKIKSVQGEIDTLTHEVIELKIKVQGIPVWSKKESDDVYNTLKKMITQINKYQNHVNVITRRIEKMIQRNEYISKNEADKLKLEKNSLEDYLYILIDIHTEAHEELVERCFWATLKDAYQNFTERTNLLAKKVSSLIFTGLIRPMINGDKDKPKLPPARPWWKIF